MKLIWFIYSNHADLLRRRYKRKYMLGILLGEIYGKLHVLETNKLSDEEVLLIRTYVDQLVPMYPEQRMQWLRDQLKATFNKAYKTIYKDRIEIMDEFPISKLGDI